MCVGARARAGVGTWVRASRGVGAGVTVVSRASRFSRATNRYQRSLFRHTLQQSVHFSEPSVGIRSCPAF